MRVSMGLPVHDWSACAKAARQAEEDGVDVITSNELRHDPFTPLAFAALATERVALVPSVAIAFPRSPMIVANHAWDLQRHSRGRFVVGLGSQVKAHNERRFSVPWIAPAARLGEYVEALRAIFRCWPDGQSVGAAVRSAIEGARRTHRHRPGADRHCRRSRCRTRSQRR